MFSYNSPKWIYQRISFLLLVISYSYSTVELRVVESDMELNSYQIKPVSNIKISKYVNRTVYVCWDERDDVHYFLIRLYYNMQIYLDNYFIYGNNTDMTIRGLPTKTHIEFSISAARVSYTTSSRSSIYFELTNATNYEYLPQMMATTPEPISITRSAEELNREKAIVIGGIISGIIAFIIIAVGITFLILWFNCGYLFYRKDLEKSKAVDFDLFKRPYPIEWKKFKTYYRESKMNCYQALRVQFEILSTTSRFPISSTILSTNIAESCPHLNRFKNIIPYDFNVVKLKEEPYYINASYLRVRNDFGGSVSISTIFEDAKLSETMENSTVKFIATQAPFDDTVNEFWRCIWENNVGCIVMLTSFNYEKTGNKCLKYWPDSDSIALIGDADSPGCIAIEVLSHGEMNPDVKLTVIQLTMNEEVRTINHYQYHTWIDHQEPSLEPFAKLVRVIRNRENGSNKLKLVHCMAGVGRTGTFITAWILQEMIRKRKYIDIFGIILYMRQYRKLFVQTEEQYIFLHRYANFILDTKRTNDSILSRSHSLNPLD